MQLMRHIGGRHGEQRIKFIQSHKLAVIFLLVHMGVLTRSALMIVMRLLMVEMRMGLVLMVGLP